METPRPLALSSVVMLLLLVSGCGGGAPTAPGSGTSAPGSGAQAGCDPSSPTAIQVAYDTVSQGMWPVWIAEEEGIFDDYGIDASLVFVEGNRVAGAMISGQAPIGTIAGTDILSPVAQGADLKAIMGIISTPTDMIVGAKGVAGPDDLKGKVVGANELGGEADTLLRLALERMGLEPDVDVTVVAVGGESVRIAALESGQVQATIVDVGLRDAMAEQGYATLYDFTTGDVAMLKNAVATTQTFIDENPETVQCVVNAVVDAIAFMKDHKEESVDAAAAYSGDMNRETLEGLWDIYSTKIPDEPVVDMEALRFVQELSDEEAVKALDVADIIDNSFVEAAETKP